MLMTSALVLMLSAGAFQAATPTQFPAQPDQATLERIREGLSAPPAVQVPEEVRMLVPEKPKRPTFRVVVEERTPPPPWEEDPVVPSYVRTQRPAFHHEYLAMVTPEAFRAGTLYPGMNVLPALEEYFQSISDDLRERRVQEIRRKIRKELDWFNVSLEK